MCLLRGVNGTYAANGAYVAGFMGSAYFEFLGSKLCNVQKMATA